LNTLLLRKPWNQWLADIFGQINANRERGTKKVPDIDIMNDISRIGTMLGKPPTQRDYGQNGSYPLSMVLRRKKWNEWLESSFCSVNYNRSKDSKTKKIPEQDLIDDVRHVANELGHAPTRGEYDKWGRYSSDTIVVRKPWVEFATEACGEKPASIQISKTKATEEELLEQLKILAKTLKRTPLKEDLGGQNGFSYIPYVRAFGTFGNALVKAGLIDPLNRHCTSRHELVDELKRVYALLGHTPSQEEFLENSPMRSSGPIYSEFGSWTKVLLEAGIPVVRARNVSVEDIKTALRKWHAENNGDDSCLEYWKIRKAKKNLRFPYSCNTISAKFHPMTWEEIMRECGFPNYVTKDHYVAGRKRGNHTGADGNEYLSALELEIGNLLFELRNDGKVLSYEYEAEVCPNKAWTCDFKVFLPSGRIVWLEADGLRNNRSSPYAAGDNEKIKFYADNGMEFAIVSYASPDILRKVGQILFP